MKKIHKTCVKAISKVAGKPLRFFTLYATFSCILNKQKNDLMFREHEKTFGDNDSVVCKGEVKREVTLSKGQMFHSKKESLEELSSLLLLLQNNPYRNQGNRQILSPHTSDTSEAHSVPQKLHFYLQKIRVASKIVKRHLTIFILI